MAAKKASAKTSMSLDDQIRKAYGSKGMVSSRRSSDPGKVGPVSRREYVSSFQDVVAESRFGMGKKVMDAAARVATAEWNNTFGPKKAASKPPAKSQAKTMTASMKKAPSKKK
jgi:hypothetical protein